eukprot:3346075-Ditylum_brightwellii.AAC.1
MAGTADSVQESESVGGDDNVVDLDLSLPHLDQEGNKNKEKIEVEVRTVDETSEVSPPDTSKGSRVQEEYDNNLVSSLSESDQEGNKNKDKIEVEECGKESKNNVEGVDTGLEVYGKDDNLALSLPESDGEGNKMEVEKKVEVHEDNDSSDVSPPDTSKGSMVQEECVKESKDNLEGDDAGSEMYGKDRKEMSDSSEGSKLDILNASPSTVKAKA